MTFWISLDKNLKMKLTFSVTILLCLTISANTYSKSDVSSNGFIKLPTGSFQNGKNFLRIVMLHVSSFTMYAEIRVAYA